MTNADIVLRKWMVKTLQISDIEEKIAEYAGTIRIPLSHHEILNISYTIFDMYQKYHDPKHELQSEISIPLAEDRFSRILWMADDTNRRAIAVYHQFFYNCAPGDWREKMLVME